ncbi:MAG: EamA family transporter [Okeania sp. SIO2C9]|uniref:EamA family transporter n=1 Tax=Okeania sp. SIO2C9 TaxID=2607791 RepID=UPI0013C0B965|nr:EamA family transporter [Okeania sp. SIO2C9]NEQ77842.1 EamA family transporter [Okeania sp. SIO2C9]
MGISITLLGGGGARGGSHLPISPSPYQKRVLGVPWDKQSDRSSTNVQETYTLKNFFYLFIVAILETVCLVIWPWYLTKTTVTNSNLLHNTTPIFTVLGGWLLLSKSFGNRFLIGTILALGGTLIIAFQDFHLAKDTLLGDSIALVSAIFYAGAILVVEHLQITEKLWVCASPFKGIISGGGMAPFGAALIRAGLGAISNRLL